MGRIKPTEVRTVEQAVVVLRWAVRAHLISALQMSLRIEEMLSDNVRQSYLDQVGEVVREGVNEALQIRESVARLVAGEHWTHSREDAHGDD